MKCAVIWHKRKLRLNDSRIAAGFSFPGCSTATLAVTKTMHFLMHWECCTFRCQGTFELMWCFELCLKRIIKNAFISVNDGREALRIIYWVTLGKLCE